MFVTLIRPPTIISKKALMQHAAPPIGVAYLASSLLEAGHQVQVIDALGDGLDQYADVPHNPKILKQGLSDREVVSRIPRDVELIGISCMFSLEWPYIKALIDRIRSVFSDVPIIVGGEHVTAATAFVLNDSPAVDYCARGEGEETLVELANVLETGGDIGSVNGIAYRKNNRPFLNPPRQRIRELSAIPAPAWDLIPIENYLDSNIVIGLQLGRTMPIIASRGCPYQCTFCSNPVMWGNLWRARPPAEVLEEMKYYVEKYGAQNFDFYDLTAIVRKDWIVEMATLLIESNLNISWQLPSGTRSEAIDEEVTRLLYASGCRFINYAPESGSEEILKLIKKVIKKDRMLESMGYAVKNKMSVKANIIVGFPGETYRHVWDSFRFIVQMAVVGIHDVSVFPFSPYPGSEFFYQLEREGRVKLDNEHLHSLSQFADLTQVTSYSEHISNRMLMVLAFAGTFLFYLVSYTLRPGRFLKMVVNLYNDRPMSKLENALVRLYKRQKVTLKSNSLDAAPFPRDTLDEVGAAFAEGEFIN